MRSAEGEFGMSEAEQEAGGVGSATASGDRHSWGDAADEWKGNWRVGVATFVTLGLSFASYQSISSLFIIPLQESFGWSRGEIAFSQNGGLAAAALAPFMGRATDYFCPRKIMLLGIALSSLLYFGMAAMNGSLALFYILFVLAYMVGLSASGLTCSRVVSQTFVRSRGLSLAIARSGLALATAILPLFFYAVIGRYGWRGGYAVQGLLILVLAFPAVFFWVHRRSPDAREEKAAPQLLPKWNSH